MKTLQFIGMAVACLMTSGSKAQDWLVGGNALGRTGTNILMGITGSNNKNLVFVNTNEDGIPVERARITSVGRWGIGTAFPNARLHINSDFIALPFRASVQDDTKLIIGSGVTVGTFWAAPDNGLRSEGNLHIGSGIFDPFARLHIPTGNDASVDAGGFLVAGQTNSTNMAIDDNEIMARNNGVPSTLYLNNDGGDVNFISNHPDFGAPGAYLFVNGTTGEVGVRTDQPVTELHLLHENNDVLYKGFRIQNQGANNHFWHYYVSNIGNGDMTISHDYAIKGLFNGATGAYSTVSDARMKKNIEDAGTLLPVVTRLQVKKYHLLSSETGDKKQFGFLAQETEQLLPELVQHHTEDNGSDVYTMDYSNVGVIAIKSLQEQQAMIKSLQNDIAALISKRKEIQDRIRNAEAGLLAIFAQ